MAFEYRISAVTIKFICHDCDWCIMPAHIGSSINRTKRSALIQLSNDLVKRHSVDTGHNVEAVMAIKGYPIIRLTGK